jgi:GAF domain-containing protein
MKIAAIPENEAQRLEALIKYEILDTLPEAAFDNVTRLASKVCKTPIALISLIDKDRQWFKSKVGLEVSETHRDIAFCAHAVADPGHLLIVEDTLKDNRFSNNPLVVNQPNLRFYAGCPLLTSTGEALGTLCVLDQKPKSLSEDQQEILRVLADQVMAQLETRHALRLSLQKNRQLEKSQERCEKVVHRLKAPLEAIETNAKWLDQNLPEHLAGKVRQQLNSLLSGIAGVLQLLNGLLVSHRAAPKP